MRQTPVTRVILWGGMVDGSPRRFIINVMLDKTRMDLDNRLIDQQNLTLTRQLTYRNDSILMDGFCLKKKVNQQVGWRTSSTELTTYSPSDFARMQ